MNNYWLGIDVGSTTVKTVVLDPITKKIVYSKYLRHNAKQSETILELLKEIDKKYKNSNFEIAVCGSGGSFIADYTGLFFVQEVVANAIAIGNYYPNARTAIELGGQDAKVIFFHHDEKTDKLIASDMRMNGSCAGGTGAFIDQIAEILNVGVEEFNDLAKKSTTLYDISGRCGVFAKTDIQPLLNQGVPKSDIALSSFHAIAKQTIGGLAQGAEIVKPVIFEGGPLTFNTELISVFKERLGLNENEIIIPENPEIIVAAGAALSIGTIFEDKKEIHNLSEIIKKLSEYKKNYKYKVEKNENFFESTKEEEEFFKRHKVEKFEPKQYNKGENINIYIGIDAGSTTSKFVLIDEDENIINKFYSNNAGEPIDVVKNGLLEIKDYYDKMGVNLTVKGVGTTGYGELLFAKAFKADYHIVETVAHAEAAFKYAPDVSFILDIGGQDMKAINIKNKIVTGIVLNEACSAGCGSFIETYSKALKIPVEEISKLAFKSKNPSKLGSRCTVFMNSSIITEQKNGRSVEDIMAGLCRSVIENVFTKVVRVSNFNSLGNTILAQGGTFKNDAVLRAMEQYTGIKVVRPPHSGEMGAIGVALLTKKNMKNKKTTSFIGFENLETFNYKKISGSICKLCTNNCSRTIVEFNDKTTFVTGNRCERGEVIGDLKDESTLKELKNIMRKKESVPDLLKYRNKILFENYAPKELSPKKNIKIGIPRVLEFWNSLPFWKSFYTSLGFEVIVSDKSSYKIFEDGLKNIPSDTVCFPAKIVHGHIKNLIDKKVDRIFMPMMMDIPPENEKHKEAVNMCAVIQGYPLVIKENDEPEKSGVIFDTPMFRWTTINLRDKQLIKFINESFGLKKDVVENAILEGDIAQNIFKNKMLEEGKKVLEQLEKENRFGVVIASRPYHSDELINHNISSFFVNLNIPVLTLDSLPGLNDVDLSKVRPDTVNPFHTRLFTGAIYTAKNKNLEFVEVVSFGCGHEAINSDEVIRLMNDISQKQPLIMKLDESEVKGPMTIRINSFIETIKSRREKQEKITLRKLKEPFGNSIFSKKDKGKRTIYVPILSETFAKVVSAVLSEKGYNVQPLPIAGDRAKALGKKYVHNDICYPAQINIGEMLAVMEDKNPKEVTFGIAKNCNDCRAGQYLTLARKALDEAGYKDVSIITTGEDNKGIQPGIKLGLWFQLGMLYGLVTTDALEYMKRRIRPYEKNRGETNQIFEKYVDKIVEVMKKNYKNSPKIVEEAIEAFNNIELIEQKPKPKVFVIGEILMNYHPSANENIEGYLEANGMETIFPSFIDFFRRDMIKIKEGIKNSQIEKPVRNFLLADVTDKIYQRVVNKVEKRLKKFKFYEYKKNVHELAENIDGIIDKTYTTGEGWLIPAEIIEHARNGVKTFIIVQPFGCIPNHITGRGMTKSLKKMFPDIQILSLDYDPDTSFANIENRLQMVIMTAKEMNKLSL
ncbi:acyl-CoA dehydratase activase [Haliovirga abyssi]|uniref:2-hydroxyglutaryl-CoA dehydratase n=1 Tax=Haliovirga abyssi TaxID=2996794 RepID=A0AAU9E177_9FUSO|nr:acyl-CoA dehydratase activase [Haliovirga abyssi]BDU51710.1 2-hydroxyglutaryl-CoA dehydratase [Haliovirga abyssi]